MNIFRVAIFIAVNFSISNSTLMVPTFFNFKSSNADLVKNVKDCFKMGNDLYMLYSYFIGNKNENKPNLNELSKALSALDKNMQVSLKGVKEILMDQHFQTHVELPIHSLYRHVTTFITNPTTVSEKELTEACSKRYSPTDILSNLSTLLRKQWLVNKLKDTDYDGNTVDDTQIFFENLIKQLIIVQSFCIEFRHSNDDTKSYRVLTVQFVEEIRSLILKQIETLNITLNYRAPSKPHSEQHNNLTLLTTLLDQFWSFIFDCRESVASASKFVKQTLDL